MKHRISTISFYMMSAFVGILAVFGGIIAYFLVKRPDAFVQLAVMGGLWLIALPMPIIGRRQAFSTVAVNEEGVTLSCFLAKDTVIAWDECAEVGLFRPVKGAGYFMFWIYVSRREMSDDELRTLDIRSTSETIVMELSSEVLEEISKYVDPEEIKNYEYSWIDETV